MTIYGKQGYACMSKHVMLCSKCSAVDQLQNPRQCMVLPRYASVSPAWYFWHDGPVRFQRGDKDQSFMLACQGLKSGAGVNPMKQVTDTRSRGSLEQAGWALDVSFKACPHGPFDPFLGLRLSYSGALGRNPHGPDESVKHAQFFAGHRGK